MIAVRPPSEAEELAPDSGLLVRADEREQFVMSSRIDLKELTDGVDQVRRRDASGRDTSRPTG
jgi:hypothetical protein